MTTFTIAGSGAGAQGGADPSTVTLTAGATGRLWVAVLQERSGLGHSGHSVSDDNTGTWTKQGSLDSLLSDSAARNSLSIWTHVTVSADTSPTVISGDAGAGNSRLYLFEISPSAAYDWTFAEVALGTSGTAHWNGQGSGSTSNISGSDLFVMGFGAARLDVTPTTATALTQTTNHTDFGAGQHQYFGCAAISGTGESGGVKSTTLTVTAGGTDDEGIVGVIVFRNGPADSTLSGAGVGGSSIIGASTATGDVSGAGVGAGSIVGASIVEADVSGAGVGGGAVVGESIASGDVSGAGVGGSVIVGGSIAEATLTGVGVGSASIVSTVTESVLTGAGIGGGALAGAAIVESVLTGAGVGVGSIVGVSVGGGWIEEAPVTGAWSGEGAVSGSWSAEGAVSGTWTEEGAA